MTAPLSFSQRIAQRLRVWWYEPPEPGDRLRRYSPHQLQERYIPRRRDDPDAVWHCCAHWQRTLGDKANAREFALKHECPVPRLYWRSHLPSPARLRELPAYFVLRPTRGTQRQGVYVVAAGHDVLRDRPFRAGDMYRSIAARGKLAWTIPILGEEFVRAPDGTYRLPPEYKCYVFGDHVAAIQAVERTGPRPPFSRFYTAEWHTIDDPMNTTLPLGPPRDPPPALAAMVRCAARLGAAAGTFMRIDFFATVGGCVFNEFASTPIAGKNFTPHCDRLFGALWEERFPHAT
jgi:hypothetical protein